MNPLASTLQTLKILSNNLPYCLLQSTMFYCKIPYIKMPKIFQSNFNPLINSLFSRYEKVKIISNNLLYCFLQSTKIHWKILLVETTKISNALFIPSLIR